MKNLYIYCEGQTEEAFVKEILRPYFWQLHLQLIPIICMTKRTGAGKHKGGITDYAKVKAELTRICREHSRELVTTMFDYYGLPGNTPGINCHEVNFFVRANYIEREIEKDIGADNLFVNLVLHEFEGLLFSAPEAFENIANSTVVDEIRQIKNQFASPEHINDSVETAPSKRLEKLIPRYAKVRNSIILSRKIGLDKLTQECQHFAGWINRIREYSIGGNSLPDQNNFQLNI